MKELIRKALFLSYRVRDLSNKNKYPTETVFDFVFDYWILSKEYEHLLLTFHTDENDLFARVYLEKSGIR